MIFMKPIHNTVHTTFKGSQVVIPHKVNDFYETNSQLIGLIYDTFIVVIPHKVNDFYETNSQLSFYTPKEICMLWFLTKLMIFMKPIHNTAFTNSFRHKVVIPHKVNDFYETNSQQKTPCL